MSGIIRRKEIVTKNYQNSHLIVNCQVTKVINAFCSRLFK